MVQTYFIVQLIYWQKQKQSDHRNNLKETNENGATVIFAFSQQAPKLLTRTKKEKKRVVKDSIWILNKYLNSLTSSLFKKKKW